MLTFHHFVWADAFSLFWISHIVFSAFSSDLLSVHSFVSLLSRVSTSFFFFFFPPAFPNFPQSPVVSASSFISSLCVFDPAALSPVCHGWSSCRSDWNRRTRVHTVVPPHPWRRNDNISLFHSPFSSLCHHCCYLSLYIFPTDSSSFLLCPDGFHFSQSDRGGLGVHLNLSTFLFCYQCRLYCCEM